MKLQIKKLFLYFSIIEKKIIKILIVVVNHLLYLNPNPNTNPNTTFLPPSTISKITKLIPSHIHRLCLGCYFDVYQVDVVEICKIFDVENSVIVC
jgi:hypothetical protein